MVKEYLKRCHVQGFPVPVGRMQQNHHYEIKHSTFCIFPNSGYETTTISNGVIVMSNANIQGKPKIALVTSVMK